MRWKSVNVFGDLTNAFVVMKLKVTEGSTDRQLVKCNCAHGSNNTRQVFKFIPRFGKYLDQCLHRSLSSVSRALTVSVMEGQRGSLWQIPEENP